MPALLLLILGLAMASTGILTTVGGGQGAEASPTPAKASSAASCDRSRRTVVVDLDNRRHRRILQHSWAARRRGHPEHLHIDRRGADRRRDAALRRYPPRPGRDRDEYPPAIAREGGAGASVRYVDPSANRSAGATMGAQLSRFCDGQSFRFERRPR